MLGQRFLQSQESEKQNQIHILLSRFVLLRMSPFFLLYHEKKQLFLSVTLPSGRDTETVRTPEHTECYHQPVCSSITSCLPASAGQFYSGHSDRGTRHADSAEMQCVTSALEQRKVVESFEHLESHQMYKCITEVVEISIVVLPDKSSLAAGYGPTCLETQVKTN